MEEKSILKELVYNLFIQKAMFDDYCRVIANIENTTAEDVQKRILVDAQKKVDNHKNSDEFKTFIQEYTKRLKG